MNRTLLVCLIGVLATRGQDAPEPAEADVELAKPGEGDDEIVVPKEVEVEVPEPAEAGTEMPAPAEVDSELLEPEEIDDEIPELVEAEPEMLAPLEEDLGILERVESGFDDLEPVEPEADLLEPIEADIDVLDPVVVVGTKEIDTPGFHLLPSEVVGEETLKRIAQGTLGDTLGWQPGVNASSYGQGASRPIIRGFDGFRVRILRDSIGTLDVSASSPDHGLPLEPLLLRKVEILRGPAALLYGSSALGGAVNSTTRSFATELPERTLSGAIETRWDSVSSGWTNVGYADVKMGDFVLSLTGSHRDAGNYDIPGRARTKAYENRFTPLVNDPETGSTVPIENPAGTLPNSFHESSSSSLGLSWFPEDVPLEVSVAFSQFKSDFGLPYLYGGDANDLFGDSSLKMEQDRFDFRVRYLAERPWLSEATLHFGYGDYDHSERFDGRGKDQGTSFIDTLFGLKAWEARLDLIHEPTDWLRGVAGIQFSSLSLDPSFLSAAPRADSRFRNRFETSNLGLFINETASIGSFKINAAFRWETQTIDDLSLAEFGITRQIDDTSFSAIFGGSWEGESVGPLDRLKIDLNASFIERIPTETERFAFWNSPAIQRFLIGGDLDGTPLETEQSLGIDLGLEADLGDLTAKVNFFFYQIDDYIFLQDLSGIGNQAQYTATDAEFYGVEAQLDWSLYEEGEKELTLSLMGDWMRASQRGGGSALPRIPPLRLGSRLQLENGPLKAGLEIRHAFSQERVQEARGVTEGELPSDAYTEVNLDLSYDFELKGDTSVTLFAQLRNLLDEERRHHTSFLKDVAPISGRNLTLGARFEF